MDDDTNGSRGLTAHASLEDMLTQPFRATPTDSDPIYVADDNSKDAHLQVRPYHPKRMGPLDESTVVGHQAKKKRIEDEQSHDVGQKPLQLQRRRVWRACESCRRKKIKCDGCEPTCAQCQASGSTCTWLQTKDRAALSRHYVQELESRLLHMESLFTQLTPVLQQLPSLNLSGVAGLAPSEVEKAAAAPTSGQAITSHSTPESQSDEVTSSPSSSQAMKIEDDVSESLGQLTLDEHGHMRWIGDSSTMSLIQSFRNLTTSPFHRLSPTEENPLAPGPSANKLYFPASVFFGKVHVLPGAEEVEYPPEDLADKLVDTYFSRFHFLMPILDKPSFMRQYQYLMANRTNLALVNQEASFISVVFSVFACAAKLVEDPRLAGENLDDGGMGMIYYERAQILHYMSHTTPQPSHVQCFILMASFLCSVNCLPQAWLVVGQAMRVAQDLGLHRSPRRLTISPVEKETRRKIWWGVYALDRMLALALGRPLGIEDTDCDVEFPAEVDDENLPEYFNGSLMPQKYPSLMTGNIALCILYKIAGRILREVYSLERWKDILEPEKRAELQPVVEALDSDLTKWCDDLPIVFKSSPANDQQVSMGAALCSHYYIVLTTLHRNFIPVKPDQPAAPQSSMKALNSARSSIRLAPTIKHVLPPSHHLAFFIQHLFSSAVIILLFAMHSTDQTSASAAMDQVRSCHHALESWEGVWPGARKCKELLIELTNNANDAVKSTLNNNRPPPPSQMPPPMSPPLADRRQAPPASTSPSGSSLGSLVNRTIKNKPRRMSSSREPIAGTRRAPVSTPYNVLSQRARSTSRKRGQFESEIGDRSPSSHLSYLNIFSSTPPNAAKPSPHSSPGSVNHPSPPMSTPDIVQTTDGSRLMGSSPFSYSRSSLSPLSTSSPTRFEYDFTGRGAMGQPNTNQWAPHAELRGLDMYPSTSQNTNASYSSGYDLQPSSFESTWYNETLPVEFKGFSSTPPAVTLEPPGLPFHGLDFIRNYSPGLHPQNGDQYSLWQGFDAGAFGVDPDLPFALGEYPLDERHE